MVMRTAADPAGRASCAISSLSEGYPLHHPCDHPWTLFSTSLTSMRSATGDRRPEKRPRLWRDIARPFSSARRLRFSSARSQRTPHARAVSRTALVRLPPALLMSAMAAGWVVQGRGKSRRCQQQRQWRWRRRHSRQPAIQSRERSCKSHLPAATNLGSWDGKGSAQRRVEG